MKRIVYTCLATLFATVAFGELDPKALSVLDNIRRGVHNDDDAIRVLYVKESLDIPAGSIDAADLATDSVAAAEIAAGAVGTSEIATDGVGAAEIAADAVGSSEIAANAVGTSELAGLTAVASASVTNGQVITLSAGAINQYASGGGVANDTNTVTFANFAALDVGKPTYVVNVSTATNLLAVAVAGNYVGPAFELAPGESRLILPVATNILYSK